MSATVNLPFSPEDVKSGWKCAGCGCESPDRVRSCECPTNVVTMGRLAQWKIDPPGIEPRIGYHEGHAIGYLAGYAAAVANLREFANTHLHGGRSTALWAADELEKMR